MSIFDLSLLIVLGGFVLNGLSKGIIRLVGNVVGLVLGAYIASHYYLNFFDWFKNWGWIQTWVTAHGSWSKIIAFIVLFVLATRLIGLFFTVIEKIFKFVAIIPGSKYLNNLLGAILGLLEGSLFLGLIIYVISRYTLITNFFGEQLINSTVAPFLLKIVNIVLPLLPSALTTLKSII
ncbi:MAG: CvpA family protein [Patescibacteria group bacterium]|jgi:membrane protein required for colicin V production